MNAESVESILSDFRTWLLGASEATLPSPQADLDVATIVQHFTALRHEVHLQTKSSRAQLEQNAQMLGALEKTVESLQNPPQDDDLLRPLLKALVDAHDALSLAEREVRRLLTNTPPATVTTPTAPPEIKIRLPHWTRWVGLDIAIESQLAPFRAWRPVQPAPDDSATSQRKALDALLVGYSMSVQRLERALQQQGLEPVDCVGKPFDPETMEVAEVVREEGRPGTEVLNEIRRGYFWRGRLFRYAHVRVAKA